MIQPSRAVKFAVSGTNLITNNFSGLPLTYIYFHSILRLTCSELHSPVIIKSCSQLYTKNLSCSGQLKHYSNYYLILDHEINIESSPISEKNEFKATLYRLQMVELSDEAADCVTVTALCTPWPWVGKHTTGSCTNIPTLPAR